MILFGAGMSGVLHELREVVMHHVVRRGAARFLMLSADASGTRQGRQHPPRLSDQPNAARSFGTTLSE